MPYRGQWAVIPAGQGGLTSDENPTRNLPQELIATTPTVGTAALTTQGITQEDGVWRRERGATSLDAAGITDLSYKGTLSVAAVWGLALTGYGLSSAATVATTHGATNKDVAGTTVAHLIASAVVPVGSLLAVALGRVLAVGDTGTVSVADSKGNTWTLSGTTHGVGDIARASLATTIVTTQLDIGSTVTFTCTNSFIGATVVAVSFTNATTLGPRTVTSSPTESTTVIGTLSPTATYPAIHLAAVVNLGLVPITLTNNTGYTTALRETAGTWADVAICYRVDAANTLTVLGLLHWRPTTTASDWAILTAASDGKLYKSNAAGTNLDATTLVTGLSTTARPGRWITAGAEAALALRHAVYMNGVDIVQVLDGTTTTMNALASPPADWTTTSTIYAPVNGMIHRNRLCGFGNLNFPHRVYFSTTGDHEDFLSSGKTQVDLAPGLGERLYGCAGWQGLAWFWKYPYGVFWIDDSDADAALWTSQLLSDAVGCAPSPYAVLPLGNDVMFLTADGRFMLLSQLKESAGAASTQAISSQLRLDKWLRETLTLSSLGNAVSVWYPQRRQAIWGLPANGSTSNTLRLTWDFEPTERGGMPVVTPSYRDTADALALFREADQIERPMIGQGAQVYLLERAARTKDGGAYSSLYCTPHMDLRFVDRQLAARRKQFDQLIIHQNVNPSGSANTYTIYVFLDRTLRKTLTGSTATRWQRHLIGGAGHEIALAVRQEDAGSDFAIIEHLLGFVPLDEGPI